MREYDKYEVRTAVYHVTALTRSGSAKITAVVRAVPTWSHEGPASIPMVIT